MGNTDDYRQFSIWTVWRREGLIEECHKPLPTPLLGFKLRMAGTIIVFETFSVEGS